VRRARGALCAVADALADRLRGAAGVRTHLAHAPRAHARTSGARRHREPGSALAAQAAAPCCASVAARADAREHAARAHRQAVWRGCPGADEARLVRCDAPRASDPQACRSLLLARRARWGRRVADDDF
jgi:hypothetical protein